MIIIEENGYMGLDGIQKPDFSKLTSDRHSEEIHEIITKVPKWIVRWGITLLFIILFIAISISVIVRYPDTIKVGLKLEAVNTAKPVNTTEAGFISKVFIKKNQIVRKGQPLAEIQSETTPEKSTVLVAPYGGRVAFVGIAQKGYFLKANQEVFRIIPENELFFGTIKVSQNQINKIKEGQSVLVKLDNYPVEEYGVIKGKISYVADEPSNDGFFAIQVAFKKSDDLKNPIRLKAWMIGSAEIITKDVSLSRRFYNLLVKELK